MSGRVHELLTRRHKGTKIQMDDELEAIAKAVVDCSMKIHMALGPGLLESVYAVILKKKMEERGYRVEREKPVPVSYEGARFEMGFRADLVVNERLIIELKSVERLAPVHAKQLLTYLKLTETRLGRLINFGEALLKDGIKRIAN